MAEFPERDIPFVPVKGLKRYVSDAIVQYHFQMISIIGGISRARYLVRGNESVKRYKPLKMYFSYSDIGKYKI
jgi:hypothetical protein